MSKNIEGKEDSWSMALGLYPGLLFGVRTYEGPIWSQVVFYIPFIDLAIEWNSDEMVSSYSCTYLLSCDAP